MSYFGNIIAGIKTTAQGLKITGSYLGKNIKSRGDDASMGAAELIVGAHADILGRRKTTAQ